MAPNDKDEEQKDPLQAANDEVNSAIKRRETPPVSRDEKKKADEAEQRDQANRARWQQESERQQREEGNTPTE